MRQELRQGRRVKSWLVGDRCPCHSHTVEKSPVHDCYISPAGHCQLRDLGKHVLKIDKQK